MEEAGCEGLLLSEMEEVLVCAERQLPLLVHQRGGGCHVSTVHEGEGLKHEVAVNQSRNRDPPLRGPAHLRGMKHVLAF